MEEATSKNITIAKNSIFLFARTFISIIVTLFTSRVFLNQLGVEDYGIYNLVGGVVAVFSVLTSFMTGATQRFLSIEIGKDDIEGMNKVLNISISIHILLGIILIVIGEIVGLILLNNYLNIPEGKEFITTIVFHFAILTSVVSLFRIPYNALIIAREHMSFFALITIAEVIAKLLITLALVFTQQKLFVYSLLFLVTTSIITYSYYYYCKKRLHLPKYKYYSYKGNNEYKLMLSYSGWSFVGYFASTMKEQGGSFILNIFHGVLLNAAMGVVNQATNVFTSLFLNLQSAFRPQLMQSTVNDRSRYDSLMNVCTFYTILLMGLICTPMIIGANSILTIWLGIVPEYSVLFVQLMMLKIFIASVSQCFSISIEAYAELKPSMIASVLIAILFVVVSYLLLKVGLGPSWVIIMLSISELLYLLYRAYYCSKNNLVDLKSMMSYNWKALSVVVLFLVGAFFISRSMDGYIIAFMTMAAETVIYCVISLIIMKKNQREFVFSKLRSILHLR